MSYTAIQKLKFMQPLKILIMFLFNPAGRLSVCIIYTLLFQVHLQFNEVLHQRKLALHKEFVLLQPNDCDGLQPGQNGGFQCRIHAVHIITVDKMSHGAVTPSGTSRWLLKQVGMHLWWVREQPCSNMAKLWYHFCWSLEECIFCCLRPYPWVICSQQ